MKSRFLWKLWSINALTIGLAFFIVWMAVDYFAADYFMVLMDKYNISPTAVHGMFLEATHRALIAATIGALLLAGLLSLLLTKKVLRPLTQMAESAKRITSGDYTTRVEVASQDEVGRLGDAFNQMSASLEKINSLRRNMVIDIAHELRTPLTNVRGYLEALSSGVIEPTRESFESLHEETLRLTHLVEQLLDLARADAASFNLHPRRVDLCDLLRRAIDLFQTDLARKGIHVQSDFENLRPVIADPDKILQVIRNLLANACQYTPPHGHVRIVSERLEGGIKITVSNSGETISSNDLPFIFERFYRGEKSRSRDYGGAGIGLAIAKELVEAHGGHVGAQSSEKETHVWFFLPTHISNNAIRLS